MEWTADDAAPEGVVPLEELAGVRARGCVTVEFEGADAKVVARLDRDLTPREAYAETRDREPRSRAETHRHHQHLPGAFGPLAEPALIAACGAAWGR